MLYLKVFSNGEFLQAITMIDNNKSSQEVEKESIEIGRAWPVDSANVDCQRVGFDS